MSAAPVSPAMRTWRIALVVLGLALLVVGTITLLTEVAPERYLGIAAWLLGALIVHDGIAAMAVFGASIVLRRVGRRVPWVVIVIIQSALVIAAIVSALVVPEILKQGIGSANPTILTRDYGTALLVFYVVLAALTALAIGAALAARRARSARANS